MRRASAPRRAAASAGIVVALAAGATSGVVAADLERTDEVGSPAVSVATPATPDLGRPGPVVAPTPSLTPAPGNPQNSRAGQVPHTTTRAS